MCFLKDRVARTAIFTAYEEQKTFEAGIISLMLPKVGAGRIERAPPDGGLNPVRAQVYSRHAIQPTP